MFAASGFWVFLPFFIPGLLADACYHVNGDAIKDPAYVPCNLITPGVASSCCPTKRADFPSVCLANGLCSNDNDIFRGSCTDKTWKSKSCPQLCTTGFGQRRQDVGDPVGGQNAFLSLIQSQYNEYNYCGITYITDNVAGQQRIGITRKRTFASPPVEMEAFAAVGRTRHVVILIRATVSTSRHRSRLR